MTVCKNCSLDYVKGKNSLGIYCSNKCQAEFQSFKKIAEGTASDRCIKTVLKRCITFCEVCETSIWNGRPVPLELDHIDGNCMNNSLDNLRIVCPNCHAQTSTYKSRNNGRGRHYRRQRYKEGKSY